MDVFDDPNLDNSPEEVEMETELVVELSDKELTIPEDRVSHVSLLERVASVDVPISPPVFSGGGTIPSNEPLGTNKKLARENFGNYHAGINYLVQKYGSRRVNKALGQVGSPARESHRLELEPDPDGSGREKLKPCNPNGLRHKTFGESDLHKIEAKITESGKAKKSIWNLMLEGAFTALSIIKFAITLNGDGICEIFVKLFEVSSSLCDDGAMIAGKRVPFPKILAEEEKVIFHGSEKNLAQENFRDFYEGMKYLVDKYGSESLPGNLLEELIEICHKEGLQSPCAYGGDGKLKLPDRPPSGTREKPFTEKDLRELENQIAEKKGDEKVKTVAKMVGAALSGIGAILGLIASLGTGSPVFIPVILASISCFIAAIKGSMVIAEASSVKKGSTKKNPHKLEKPIIGEKGVERVKKVANVAAAVLAVTGSTIGLIATVGTGAPALVPTIIASISFLLATAKGATTISDVARG
jgi:hypothetical protein